MFDLDIKIIQFIYDQCKTLGQGLGFGALEGAITYFIIVAGSTLAVLEKRSGRK